MVVMSNIQIVLILCLLLSLIACSDRKRAEARVLIQELKTLEYSNSIKARQNALAKVSALRLNDTAHQRARDRCLRAHEVLLAAETQQLQAKRMVERVDSIEGLVEKETAIQQATSAIKQSEAQLRRAKPLFERCEHDLRSLTLRYGQFVKVRS